MASRFTLSMILATALLRIAPGQESPGSIPELIERLGHESWEVRDGAQRALIALGSKAVEPLIRATSSANPEISLRARQILGRVNPLQIRVRIQKLQLDDPPAITETLEEIGNQNKTGEPHEILLPPYDASRRNSSYYAVQYHILEEGEIHLNVEEFGVGSTQRYQLHPFSSRSGAIGILKRGEEIYYRQIGLHTERTRSPFLVIGRWWSERLSSVLENNRAGGEKPGDLSSLIGDLLEQARSGDHPERLTALEILGLLRAREAEGVFREAISIPQLEAAAWIGLSRLGVPGSMAGLEALVQDPPSRVSTPARESPREARGGGSQVQSLRIEGKSLSAAEAMAGRETDWQLQIILTLVEAGRTKGFEHLIGRISETDPLAIHSVLAALAEGMDRATPEFRNKVLEAVSTTEFLSQLYWSDPELEYFFSTLLDHPRIAENEKFIRKLLLSLSSCLGSNATLSPSRPRVFARLWKRASSRADGPLHLQRVLNDVLDGPSSPTRINEIVSWLGYCFHREPLPEEPFQKLTGKIRESLHSEGVSGGHVVGSALNSLSRELALTKPQFVEMMKLMAEVAEMPAQPYASSFLQTIRRLTGLSLPGRTSSPAGRPGKSAAPDRAGKPGLQETVANWASHPEEVTRAYKRRFPDPAAPGGDPLEFWEFDLLLTSDSSSSARAYSSSFQASEVQVLDGRRLTVKSGVPFQFTDRWGHHLEYRVDAQQAPGRYRLNDQVLLTSGQPTYATLSEKKLRAGAYVTSDVRFGTISILGTRSERIQRLLYIQPAKTEKPSPAGRTPEDPAQLWKEFVKVLMDNMDATSPERIFYYVKELNLKEALPYFRKGLLDGAFQRSIRTDFPLGVAHWLMENGDPAGGEYLRRELKATNPSRRFTAAKFLTQTGDQMGFRVLMDLMHQNPRGYATGILSLDSFLRVGEPTLEEYREVMDLVIGYLDNPTYRSYGFKLISSQAGQDFGYSAPGITTIQERRAAQVQAVKKAKDWWAAVRAQGRPR